MNKINNLYDKINNELTKSYELKHLKLIEEENKLKENLQNEVTKIKEKLELNLSESNKIIKISEKINKGIKLLEKNEEKNIIKTLSYISKINKIKKEINNLKLELIKSMNIYYEEDKNNIKYEEYYINGIQIPKDIEIKDINIQSFKINWKIDDIKIININNKEIKYKLEIKEENNKFKEIYEGNNNNYLIDNLNINTNYEIRICCIYNNLIGKWGEIKKIKTAEFDSNILNESGRCDEFLKKIYEWSGYKRMELIYRGSRDGSKANIFHNKCDNKGPTICLYRNEKGYIFGGYSSISWTSHQSGQNYSAPESFIFTLTNIHKTQPTKFINSDTNISVYHYYNYGPSFGKFSDIGINSDYKNGDSYSSFPSYYQDSLGKGRSIFTGDLNNNNTNFKINEIEVFKLYK